VRLAALLFAGASLCLAQLDDNTVTVTVTRNVTEQPDQAVLGITVTTPRNASLDDAIATAQGLSLAASDLLYVNTAFGLPPSTEWQFSKVVPFSGLKDALAAVLAAQQAAQKRQGFDLSLYVNGSSSQAAQQSPALCPIPTLFSNAQAQAQLIAAAAGVRVGAVASMSQDTGQLAIPTFAARTGDFTQGFIFDPSTGVLPTGVLTSFLLPPVPQPNSACTLTVQFKLLRP